MWNPWISTCAPWILQLAPAYLPTVDSGFGKHTRYVVQFTQFPTWQEGHLPDRDYTLPLMEEKKIKK